MTTWRKIREINEPVNAGAAENANLREIHELAAWPNFWVLRGGSSVWGHKLYGLDIEHNRLAWVFHDLMPPEGSVWSYKRIPFLAGTAELAVAATFVGLSRERAWLVALEPRSGALVWRKAVAWSYRLGSGNQLHNQEYIGLHHTGTHLIVMENRAQRGEATFFLWIDLKTGETVHECPAPASDNPVVSTGGYIYFTGKKGKQEGLYRISAAPGSSEAEQVLSGFVCSLMVHEDRLYTITNEEKHSWTFAARHSSTLAPFSAQTMHWEDNRGWPRFVVVDPGCPDHVIVRRETRLWGLDLCSGAKLWEQAFNTLDCVVCTSYGTLLSSDEGIASLDLSSGERLAWDVPKTAYNLLAAGDYALASRSFSAFNASSYLYVAEGSPSAKTHSNLITTDTGWNNIKLQVLLSDLLTDPRDALVTAFEKALGRGSLDTLTRTVRKITNISQVHQKVKAYLKALKNGELDNGPLNFIPLDNLYKGFFFYPDLFGFGPEERFFPGILSAGESGGVDFYIMLETGKVISLHHDASFSEVASEVWEKVEERTGAFEQEFTTQGSAFDIAQLMRFQQAFAEVKSTSDLLDLPQHDFLVRTAAAFGWNLKQLRQNLNAHSLPLEFLGIYDEGLAELDAMLTD